MILSEKNITVTDVKKALQAGTNSVGALCTHDNIIKWAKYKPVNLNTPTPSRQGEWWKGEDDKCGIEVGIKKPDGTVSPVTNIKDMSNADWYYKKVKDNYPKRLADFGKYNTEASPFIYTNITEDVVTVNKSITGNTYTVAFDIAEIGDDTVLNINDFNFLKNYYFAAGINVKGVWRESRGTSVIASDAKIDIDLTGIPLGTYDVVLFAATNQSTGDAGEMIPLPNDAFNKTSYKLKITQEESMFIDILFLSERFPNPRWVDVDTIPPVDEDGNGGYKSRTKTIYYKAKLTRTSLSNQKINAEQLNCQSQVFDNFDGVERGLKGSLFNIDGTPLNQLITPGKNIGDYTEFVIKWDYFTSNGPVINNPLDAALTINKIGGDYIGGGADFQLTYQ